MDVILYSKLSEVKNRVESVENELVSKEWEDVSLTLTAGTYYKTTGKSATYSTASHSQPISVSPGDKLKVTARSENTMPGIVYFNSDTPGESSCVGYDCYTGSQTTFTDEEVTVPSGASYAVVQGKNNGSYVIKLKKCQVTKTLDDLSSRMTSAETNITNEQANDKYMSDVMCNRLMALGKRSGFSWGTRPKFILSLRVDDLRADVDKIAKIIIDEYGFPLMVAACQKELNKTATGITDPAERIGDTRLDVCKWVQNHGGEIVLHPDSTVTDADYATSVKPLFLDARKTFENNGLIIRGTAVANSTPSAALKAKLDPYMYGYFDYSDGYGSIAPYSDITTTMIGGWDSDVSQFNTWLTGRIASTSWRTLVMHQLGDDVTEQALRDMLDILATHVQNEDLILANWSTVFDTYGEG